MDKLVWEYKLKTPATLGERTITVLKFKRPKTKDFVRTENFPASSVSADIALASSLTGEPESLLSEIDVDDWAVIRTHIAKLWASFFGVKENFTKQESEMAAESPTA